MPYDDFRQFLDVLRANNELIDIDRPISLEVDMARAMRRSNAIGGPAMIFTQNGTDIPLVAGVFSTRSKALLAFESSEDEITQKLLHGLEHPIDPVMYQGDAPCQEVVITGDDIDIAAFPIPRYSPLDGGRYITPGLVVSHDPETGIPDIGHYRFMYVDGKTLAFSAQPFHRFGKNIAKALKLGVPLRAALVIGTDPVLAYAAQAQMSDETDDWRTVGGLRGAPVELVRCRTADIDVPATAEVVIEFEVDAGNLVMEGPLGEYTGYYTPRSEKPVAKITAITHRRNPYFQGLLTGKPVTENHFLKQMTFEASFYQRMKRDFPTIKKVAMPTSGGVSFYTIIAMEPRYQGEARQAIMAAMATNMRPKWVIAVDPDIDITSSVEVEWAQSFRVDPARDVFIIDHMPAGPADPTSAHEKVRTKRVNSTIGIDATRPLGTGFDDVADVPGWEAFPMPELDSFA
jgi:2,5-furandicarboxylate decarboxylase 1